MHRIDDPTASPTLPAPRPQGTPGYFTGGSPGSGGFAATVVRYEFMNALQEELAAIVLAAQLVLDKTNNGQVLAALQRMLRFKLFQDTTLYVSPTGNDTNDGLTPTTAFATGQAAWDAAIKLDMNGYNLTIQFADGTYTTPVKCIGTILGLHAGSSVTLQGNVSSPGNVTFNVANGACIGAGNGAVVYVQGMRFQATGIGSNYNNIGVGLTVGNASTLSFNHVIFDNCQSAHMSAYNGILGTPDGATYAISHGAPAHLAAYQGAYGNITNSAISLTGTPAWTNGFLQCSDASMIYCAGCAFAGAATGPRYWIATNGVIDTGTGSNPTYLPGSTAGAVYSGGQYN